MEYVHTLCEQCDKKIKYSNEATKVLCPNCSYTFNPKKPRKMTYRRWKNGINSFRSYILSGVFSHANVLALCEECDKKILCPVEATEVMCPNCDSIFFPKPLSKPSSRGWKIAGLSLPLSLSLFLVLPLALLMSAGIEFDIDGYTIFLWTIFLTFIGTPITLIGLLLAIIDKLKVGNKFIAIEILFLILVSTNAYFVMSISGASP